MVDAFDHCEELVRAGDKDRFLATLFAPEKYRRALFALYAFNLEVARTRELAREPLPGEIRLQWWREVLAGAGRGDVAANPVAAALLDVAARYQLPSVQLSGLIDARGFDLYDAPMASLADLDRYAIETSSALFGLAAQVLSGGRDAGGEALILHSGIAFSLAGLLRALPAHTARGQLYLPADVLQRYRVDTADIFRGRPNTAVRSALAELRLHARGHLAAARNHLASAPEAILPALLPVAVVRPVLDRMERRRYQPFQINDLSQWRRQWALWRAARSGLRSAY